MASTLNQVDWNAELVRGDLGKAVQQLKRESGKGLFVAGVNAAAQQQPPAEPAASADALARAGRVANRHAYTLKCSIEANAMESGARLLEVTPERRENWQGIVLVRDSLA